MLEEKKEMKVKAKIPSKYGVIEIEGSPEAIQQIITSFNGKRSEKSIRHLLLELIASGFFDAPKNLSEIRKELSRRGFNISSSSLFPVLIRDILREGFLEREGERKAYRYFATKEQRNAASEILKVT